MTTLESIQAKIAKLQAQAEAIVNAKSTAALERIRELMEKHGIVVADVEAFLGRRAGRKPVAKAAASPARYRDPKSGATWTGHGRAPSWIAHAKDRSKFLVADSNQGVTPAENPVAGHYVRGPQPALYRDPKTGATWSGRGRAPAWLAQAKDRKKFLIAATGSADAGPNMTASRKTADATKAVTSTVSAKRAAPAAEKAAAKAASKETVLKRGAVEKEPMKTPPAKKARAKKAP